jgi:hypothetical protein
VEELAHIFKELNNERIEIAYSRWKGGLLNG